MPYRIPRFLVAAAVSSALTLGAQTSVTPGAKVQDSKAVAAAARALVQEEAQAVQSIDHFEVSHHVDITSVTPHYNQTVT